MNRRTSVGRVPVGFVIPAVVALLAIIVVPSVAGTVLTFSDYSGFGSLNWIGFDNYLRFFADPQSTQAIINTLVLAVVVVVGQNVLGLALALTMERSFRGRMRCRCSSCCRSSSAR